MTARPFDYVLAFCLGLIVVALSQGCSAQAHQHNYSHKALKAPHNAPAVSWNGPKARCRRYQPVVTRNVSVLVERNCFRHGLTTVGMVIHNTRDKGKAAAKDAVKATTRILGYRPSLSTLFMGRTNGQVFILAAVVDSGSTGPLAQRPR